MKQSPQNFQRQFLYTNCQRVPVMVSLWMEQALQNEK